MSRRHLQVALVTAFALGALGSTLATSVPLRAADRVPGENDLRKYVADLYASDNYDSTAREEILLKIDNVLATKDKKGEALANPHFWAEAIHVGMFSKSQGESGKRVKDKEIEFDLRRGGKGKADVWFRGGDAYNKKSPAPMLLCFLEEGQQPKERIQALVEGEEPYKAALKKEWVIVAVAESKNFPISQDPSVAIKVLIEARRWFNVDSDRWYFEGNGKTCAAVQKLASEIIPDRLAGVVLRNPTAPITNANSAMTTAFVLHDDTGKATAEAWSKLDEEHNRAAAAGAEGDTAAGDWLVAHQGRKLPSSYEFVTTITTDDKSGTDWTGTLRIVSVGSLGKPTNVTVTYDKDKNTVDLISSNLAEFIVYMNDDLLDLNKAVAIVVNGEEIENRVFERRMRDMFEQADSVGEFGRVFPAQYRGIVKTPVVESGDDAKKDGDGKDGDGKKDGGDKPDAGGGK